MSLPLGAQASELPAPLPETCLQALQVARAPVEAILDAHLKRTFKKDPQGSLVRVEIYVSASQALPLLNALVPRMRAERVPLKRAQTRVLENVKGMVVFERLRRSSVLPGEPVYRLLYEDANHKIRKYVNFLPDDVERARVQLVSVY